MVFSDLRHDIFKPLLYMSISSSVTVTEYVDITNGKVSRQIVDIGLLWFKRQCIKIFRSVMGVRVRNVSMEVYIYNTYSVMLFYKLSTNLLATKITFFVLLPGMSYRV